MNSNTMSSGGLAEVGVWLTIGLFGEIAVMAMVKKDSGGYKFRLINKMRDDDLEPYQKILNVSIVSILTVGAVTFFFKYIVGSDAFVFIESFSTMSTLVYITIIFLMAAGIGTYYTRGKKADENLEKLAFGIIFLILLLGQLEYDLVTNMLF